MTKYSFTIEQRLAIFTTHGEKCYMCTKPLNLQTMEVDHVLPESLLDDPPRLSKILKDFGLPADFDLESFANWLPSCRSCNGIKQATVFTPSLLIQLHLQNAQDKAQKAAEFAASQASDRAISRAWGTIEKAGSSGNLKPELEIAIRKFAAALSSNRQPEMATQPLQITPQFGIISEQGGLRIVRGPYGVGFSPLNPSGNFVCSTCGFSGWNGSRCVLCGNHDDD